MNFSKIKTENGRIYPPILFFARMLYNRTMIKEPLTFLFTGRSGCGKGTQIKLLREYLEKNDSRPILYIYVGKKMRELIENKKTLTAKLAKNIMLSGELQPVFFAIWAWGQELIDNLEEDAHLIFDGSPRSAIEAEVLDEALEFYGRGAVFPILLDVSEEWVAKRLAGRGRFDDTEERIKNRMDYFEKSVRPALDYYETKSKNELIRINGEQTIEEVHREIMGKIFNDND
ncbi:MAG: AAA family ATPase [bacterium]|nr:AAA family ATPase [bacterium]